MKAIIMQVHEALETNIALVYKSVFIGETAYILKNMDVEVQICDGTIQGYSINELIKVFCTSPELVIFVTEVQQSRLAKRVAEVCKLCCPSSKIMVIGRATSFIPQYFMRKPFDAVHINGDREAAITKYIKYLRGEIDKQQIANLCLIEEDECYVSDKIEWLAPEYWAVPDLSSLPIEAYRELNQKQHPNRKLILGITAAKGCSYGCQYCGASIEEGNVVRYGIVNRIIEWANNISNEYMIQLWSPNIMSSTNWLRNFRNTYEEKNCTFLWRGVARITSIDEEKIHEICRCNCREIAVGVEMLKKSTHYALKGSEQQLLNAIELTKKYSINLKCLLMLGYPGYYIEDVLYTIKFLKQYNLDYRITGYTPLQELKTMPINKLEKIMLENYDRRSYYHKACNIDSKLFYEIISSNGENLL